MAGSSVRVGVALNAAVARQSVRDAIEATPGVETVGVSSIAASMIDPQRLLVTDRLVFDDQIRDFDVAVKLLGDLGHLDKLVVLTSRPGVFDRRLRSRQIIEMPKVAERVGDLVVRAIVPKPTKVLTPLGGAARDASGFKRREIVVIGCSTGGPEALAVVLAQLPADFPVPIVVVQHMPPTFTRLLAERLDKACALAIREVSEPVKARRGEVWIAPGDRHLVLTDAAGGLGLDDGPEQNHCRPSVDVLFESAAATYGRRTVAVVLTGMGDDGCRGARLLDAAGAHIIAQDENTSVVWGMPGSVTRAGLAGTVVPLEAVASEIQSQFASTRMVGAAT